MSLFSLGEGIDQQQPAPAITRENSERYCRSLVPIISRALSLSDIDVQEQVLYLICYTATLVTCLIMRGFDVGCGNEQTRNG